MQELDLCKGLRIYGVYHFEKYPGFNFLCLNINQAGEDNYIEAFAFTLDGRLDCKWTVRLPLVGQEIGYIYKPNVGYSLILEFHNRQ